MKQVKEQEVKGLPHSLGTEQAVLATLMRYNEKYSEYSDLLNQDLFYYERERAIFRCIEGVIESGGITDINSMCNYAETHDIGYDFHDLLRQDILEIFPSSNRITVGQDIRRLREMAKRRMCWNILQQSAAKVLDLTQSFDEEVNGIITSVNEVQMGMSEEVVSTYGDALREVQSIVKSNATGKQQALMTGFKLFDEHYLLRGGTLTLIAAFPAVGKSALALNITENVARQGIPCAIYSMEMGKSELVGRALSKQMEVPAYVIMNKTLTDAQQLKLDMVVDSDKNLPIYFDDRSTVSFDKVIRSIRTLAKSKGVKLVVIDYLQIFNQTADSEESGLAYMARACKNVAKETGVAVIALSQLNRGNDKKALAHPSLRNLRGSGQLEESADNVVLIDRPEAYPDSGVKKYEGEFKDNDIHGTAKLILAKGRGVGLGCSLVWFNGKYTQFKEREQPDGEKYREQNEDLPF